MLKFAIYNQKGQLATKYTLRNAYLIGSDNNAMRGKISFDQGLLYIEKREAGAIALAIQQEVSGKSHVTLRTCMLPERLQPYLINLELARHRIMMIYNKLEDWGMFEYDPQSPVITLFNQAKALFFKALPFQSEEPAKAENLATQALGFAIDASEALSLAHAQILLERRIENNECPQWPVGCGMDIQQSSERLLAGVTANFDFITLPMTWNQLVPDEGEYNWALTDRWVEWAKSNNLQIASGPLLSFDHESIPNWLYMWEHDYTTIKDLVYEHIQRVITRYKSHVSIWNIASGLHVNSNLSFSFDQLMDLSRMGAIIAKKIQPQAKVVIEITEPFGEYYSTNAKSVPPLMYSDLLVQGAVGFDAFSLKILMGQAVSGQFNRDLLQLSNIIDRFANFNKKLRLTFAAPSQPVTQAMIRLPDSGHTVDPQCGYWRRPWDEETQSQWLEAVAKMAMSKPFVESINWHNFIDHAQIDLPLSGLITEEMEPKKSYHALVQFRRLLTAPHADTANQ